MQLSAVLQPIIFNNVFFAPKPALITVQLLRKQNCKLSLENEGPVANSSSLKMRAGSGPRYWYKKGYKNAWWGMDKKVKNGKKINSHAQPQKIISTRRT